MEDSRSDSNRVEASSAFLGIKITKFSKLQNWGKL